MEPAILPERRRAEWAVFQAFRRARGPIVASAVAHLGFLLLGIVLATAGWGFAVNQRDALVNGAQTDRITVALARGDRLQAALLDFGSNVLSAVPTSATGLIVVGPFPIAAYRGWVGGIVSIDGKHRSRLSTLPGATYYVVTIVLQLFGYVLTMGAGVHVGWSGWKVRHDTTVRSLGGLRLPLFALKDAAYIYSLAIPAFLVGSLWEFFLA